MKRFLEGSMYLIIEQFLQGNIPLKHLLNEETLLGNVLTEICYQRSRLTSMDNFPMISIHNFRNDGIIVAISFWQVLAEFCVNIFLAISFYYGFQGQNEFLYQFLVITLTFFSYVVFPSIFLLADQRFRNALKQKGMAKAVWLALKQKYD